MAISTAVLAMVMLSGQVGDDSVKSNPNIKFPTFGGTQVWTDQKIQSQWRIQKNVLTGHYRFLNNKNTRLAWGTLPQCQTAFAKAVRQGKIPAMKKDVVIVLHGLTRTRHSMSGTAKRIAKANPDWSVITMSYASSRETVAKHAKAVRNVVAQMKGVERVHFVGHSLGNLVVRRYLYDLQMRKPDPWPETGRIVMVAPPNQGSRIAEFFQDNPIFRAVWGVSGGQIAEWDSLAKTLAIPRSEFAIIAGGKAESKRNPLLEGQDDWVVTVKETRLPGARDFMVLPVVHSTMMGERQVQDAAVRFLKTGALRENGKREPITARP
jgi:pimeloyl-ACP methyl ester carboxylesterase